MNQVVESSSIMDFLNSIKKDGYFLNENNIDKLETINPHFLVLIRCGNGRLLCPAQNAKHFIQIITNENSDYVRDVSLPNQELLKYGHGTT